MIRTLAIRQVYTSYALPQGGMLRRLKKGPLDLRTGAFLFRTRVIFDVMVQRITRIGYLAASIIVALAYPRVVGVFLFELSWIDFARTRLVFRGILHRASYR